MHTGLGYDGLPQQRVCECCSPRTFTFTSTIAHKWTKKEIIDEIMYKSKLVADSKWYNRSERVRSLKHWTDKLERLNSN